MRVDSATLSETQYIYIYFLKHTGPIGPQRSSRNSKSHR